MANGDIIPATNYDDILTEAINQSLGDDWYDIDESTGEMRALKSYDIVTIGKNISSSEILVERFSHSLIGQLSKIVIHAKEFVGRNRWIYRDYSMWGAFTEHVWFGLGEIMDDPALNPVDGQSYADREHKFYGTKANVKLFGKDGGYLVPISIQRRNLKQAFKSWAEMDNFIAGVEMMIRNTLTQAYEVFISMIYADAIALVSEGTGHAIHTVTEWNATHPDNTYVAGDKSALENPEFLAFLMRRMSETTSRMGDYSTAFNNGEIPVFTNRNDVHTTLLDVVDSAIKFNLKPFAFNKEDLNIGDYNTVSKWQGYKTSGSSDYDFATISKVIIDADEKNTLGLGTEEITVSNVLGIMVDTDALGFTVRHDDVTTSRTAIADFMNYFHHRQCFGQINTTANMVIFTLD